MEGGGGREDRGGGGRGWEEGGTLNLFNFLKDGEQPATFPKKRLDVEGG
jgi:hypothetical protein